MAEQEASRFSGIIGGRVGNFRIRRAVADVDRAAGRAPRAGSDKVTMQIALRELLHLRWGTCAGCCGKEERNHVSLFPSFSFAVIFQCKLNDGLQVSTAQVVFTDDTIDQALDKCGQDSKKSHITLHLARQVRPHSMDRIYPETFYNVLHHGACLGMMLSALVSSLLVVAWTHDAQLVPVSWSRRLNAGTGGPELEVELSLPAASLRLRLWHNRALLPTSAQHVLHFRGRTEVVPLPENCFYIGEVMGEPSRVALSTCGGGLSGMIFRGNQTLWLDPHPEDRKEGQDRKLRGSGAHWLRTLPGQRELNSVQRFLSPNTRRLNAGSTKYVEVVAVNDFSRYSAFGGSSGLETLAAHTVAVLNAVTTIYRATPSAGSFPYPVQVVLVAQHTFLDEDPWQSHFQSNAEVDQAVLLEDFLTWSSSQMAAGSLSENDNRVLLTGRDLLGSTVGFAPVSSMCDVARSGSINMCGANNADVSNCAAVVAHEMGHNFGMSHDAGTTACPDSGYIMEAVGDGIPATQFTGCSVSDITTFFSQVYTRNSECLENKPVKVFGDPVCGNGFREEGEDCDCGSPCNDPCCNGATCKFADPSYECSDTVGSCCESCMNVTAAAQKVCRAARNTCDLAEVCPGGTSSCPKDEYTYPGAQCSLSSNGATYDGLCSMGSCKSMRYTCEVDVTRDFEGNWDLTEPCAAFNDDCSTVVCHDASKSSAADCGQYFSVHGSQMSVPDGTPCWHPSEPKGQRGSMCFQGRCTRPETLAVVPLCGNGGIDYGEECDCGSAGDACCDCDTCQLKATSACAGTDPCCDPATCSLRPSGTVCRAALGECDLAEAAANYTRLPSTCAAISCVVGGKVCSGSSAHCPPDLGKPWGSECTSGGVPSTCYANTCLPSLDKQCSDKTAGDKPVASRHLSTGSRGEAPGHLCTALMCCASCAQEMGDWMINDEPVTDPWLCSSCLRSTSQSTFTVNGESKSIYLAAAVDGTRLNGSLCVSAEATTPLTAEFCSSASYFDASVGRCLLCSSACAQCDGPTHLDCTSCARNVKDSRGACPIFLEAMVDDRAATITTTAGAAGTTGISGDGGGGDTTTPSTGIVGGSAASSAVIVGVVLPVAALQLMVSDI
ncbi:unnamed protein product [Symbiodinium natans]|uniref:Disintegrin and metalloproteinase domain-containing protein B n=1 Tax=Symbiodinium natans TaxID=878477 RepID=A0A812M6N6_9DINO|nr:unnamed protein product [Symbiodinium natans]